MSGRGPCTSPNSITNALGSGRDLADLAQRRQFLLEIFNLLLRKIGPRHWWPAESPFEVMVGAILTQNTAWKNVEKAIRALKAVGMLEPRRLASADERELAQRIRPAGYYNQKARRLKEFAAFFLREYEGSLDKMKQEDTDALRSKLLEINGIGPETADSILLYALEKPVFVVDAYTRRICSRHGWVSPNIKYEELRRFFEECLPKDVALYNEFHALLVYVGHHYCRSKPACDRCPLWTYLDVGASVEPS